MKRSLTTAMIAMALVVGVGQAYCIDLSEINWVEEKQESDCINVDFDFPASLVPIQDDTEMTGGPAWVSFDYKFRLYYETKSSFFLAPDKPRDWFQDTVKCDKHINMVLAGYLGNSELLSCESGTHKVSYVIYDQSDGLICGKVFAIALEATDISRFLVNIELCGPKDHSAVVSGVVHRMFESVRVSYAGCCSSEASYIGCKVEPLDTGPFTPVTPYTGY